MGRMFGWHVIPRLGYGGFGVSPHGVGIAFGYFIGAVLMARRARKQGYSEDHTWNGAAVGVIGAILGARIAYVTGHYSEFSSPVEWLKIWQGGISLVGGLLGAFTAVLIYVRTSGLSFFELVDLGAPGLGIGIALGRIGDLMIGDHLGKATSGFWAWTYKGGRLISPPPCLTPSGGHVYPSPDGCIQPGMTVHQTALYDSLWSLVIFAILMWLARSPRKRGFLFLSWAALYALGRIATDFARVDKHWLGLGLTGSQLTSMVVFAVCAFFLIRYRGVPGAVVPAPSESHTVHDADVVGDPQAAGVELGYAEVSDASDAEVPDTEISDDSQPPPGHLAVEMPAPETAYLDVPDPTIEQPPGAETGQASWPEVWPPKPQGGPEGAKEAGDPA